ncbi:MAG: phytanoyl-CoA dioxygenase family protein [Acidobacteria bacterium]|nr:phytanoyl-CoA dioxygenase family protein [Acidobacteriota bacterium]
MNEALIRQFEADGFLALKGFLTPEELAGIRAGWDHFERDIAPTLDRRQVMYEDYADPSTIKQSNALALSPRLGALQHSGTLHDLAVALIGPVEPQQVEYFDKPPGKNQPTPAHQDGYYFCIQPNNACTLWIPLEPVDEANGALTYVKGSHRLGLREHNSSSILGFSQGLAEDPAALGELVSCPVEPGDVLVHHSFTIHLAGPNRSATRRRRTIGYVFFPAGATRDEEAFARYEAALLNQHRSKGLAS